ncbi:inositol-trisphosphate 3-kinase homolog isoform X2 [Panonychus citri]|uniref:inositol-trisphosphate 3-kinase homolog isoform X2 n=1 Tax=Panonychus citri TaxID=50023 RepID=UPI0023081BFB|nr:inositol-trisphosphate 3-kinase homolog isoform X2 [Panonychus citri]
MLSVSCQMYPEPLNLSSPLPPSPPTAALPTKQISPLITSSTTTNNNNHNNNNNNNNIVIVNNTGNIISRYNINNNNNNSYVKSRKVNWVQLSGHENTFAFGGPEILYKKCKPDGHEVIAYKSLMEEVTMKPFIPMYRGTVTVNESCFIAIDNLLYPFDNPFIMDIKMGSRTFLEDEVSNDEPRKDLYEKMIKLDPNSLSSEEKSNRAITKLKYMQLREQLSSSSNLGFRIEAFKTESKQTAAKDLSFVKTRDEVKICLQKFLPTRRDQLNALVDRLQSIQSSFQKSAFFSTHEVIGSSLLMVYDKSKVDVWMIDFAKTVPLPRDVTIDHVSPWKLGNHEDGYLYGLQNLISIVKEF